MVSRAQFYGIPCAFLVLGVLVACLWPFHSPRNQVYWLEQGNGVRLSGYSTIVSGDAIVLSDPPAPKDWTLEVWLRPGKAYQFGTILAFYNALRPRGLSLHQWNRDLSVEKWPWVREHADVTQPADGTQEFRLADVFRGRPLVFLTLTSGPQGTKAYIDGNRVQVCWGFQLSGDDLSGQLVMANSPVNNDSWSGEVRGLALYTRELTDAQVLRHYATWTQTGRPQVTQDEALVSLYLFNEKSGNVIHNQVVSSGNLYIPERYLEVHQAFLKCPWNEYRPTREYWESVLVNIAGFVPLGFFLYGYLFLALGARRGALMAILIGGLLSLTIECLQAFLPTRDSGMTDIITNTLGTAVGVALCRWMSLACESLSDSRRHQLRHLAALLVSRGQEETLRASERVCNSS
jgi:VanZ family protein